MVVLLELGLIYDYFSGDDAAVHEAAAVRVVAFWDVGEILDAIDLSYANLRAYEA